MRAPAIATLACLFLAGALPGAARACTSFCFDTPGGPVFAVNMDLILGEGLLFTNRSGLAKEGFLRSTTGETAKWTSRYGSASFNVVGREFAWCGMNEAGLVVSQMALEVSVLPPPDERPPVDNGFWVQYVLDTCGTVEEAAGVDSLIRLQDESPCHFLVMDATGACAAIEYLGGRFVVHAGEALPVRAMANAPYADGPAYLETGRVPPFNPGDSVQRVAAAARKIEAFDPASGTSPVEYSLGVLTGTVAAPRSFWKDLFHEPYTRWSMVFDAARREVHFRTAENPRVRRFSLADFDLSCDAEVRMLDVNGEGEGEIGARFAPYDHEVDLALFRNFLDRWGVEVSREDAIGLTRFLEGFECAR